MFTQEKFVRLIRDVAVFTGTNYLLDELEVSYGRKLNATDIITYALVDGSYVFIIKNITDGTFNVIDAKISRRLEQFVYTFLLQAIVNLINDNGCVFRTFVQISTSDIVNTIIDELTN